ncbi:hypothetical protein O3P69_013194 [Scylla paramamosain]|uniref:Uncharacterized protein n=1 Tax=Scylla paramamosain TaxID=85552 RepID=A0AAW0TZP0_SCYPA
MYPNNTRFSQCIIIPRPLTPRRALRADQTVEASRTNLPPSACRPLIACPGSPTFTTTIFPTPFQTLPSLTPPQDAHARTSHLAFLSRTYVIDRLSDRVAEEQRKQHHYA